MPRAFLKIQDEMWQLRAIFIWRFVDGAADPQRGGEPWGRRVPARTEISDAPSKELKYRDFTFVGSTICYALMQATGLVNDHLVGCFRHSEVG